MYTHAKPQKWNTFPVIAYPKNLPQTHFGIPKHFLKPYIPRVKRTTATTSASRYLPQQSVRRQVQRANGPFPNGGHVPRQDKSVLWGHDRRGIKPGIIWLETMTQQHFSRCWWLYWLRRTCVVTRLNHASHVWGETLECWEKNGMRGILFWCSLFAECLFECLEVDSWVGLLVWKCMGLLGLGLRVVCVFVLFLNVVTCIDAWKCYRKKMTFLQSMLGYGL